MKDHSWIDYEIFGKRYRYAGAWPDDRRIQSAIGDASCQLGNGGDNSTSSLIREAGGTVLEVHSVRPDGSIRVEDLPDWHTD